jgi:hypothetical protein
VFAASMRAKLARLAAWVVTGGMLAYLLWRVPLGKVAEAATHASWWTIPALGGLVVVNFFADVFATWKTFGWFVAPLTFVELLTLRGATYLWALVNYALGQGALVYFVRRSRGVPLVRGAAAVLLIMGLNLLLLLLLATFGMLLGADTPRQIRLVVMAAYAGLGVYILVLLAKPRWLASRPIFDVLLAAGPMGHLKGMAVRLPHVLVLILFTYLTMRSFGVEVPLLQAMLCAPIVLFVAVLPISFQGVGVTQFLMLSFFAIYAPGDATQREARVIAASLGAWFISLCVQVLISLACLRSSSAQKLQDVSKDIQAAS